MIDVTAAVIERDGKFLVCRRPKNKGNALLWEFPGGKLEVGEELSDCLIRECREELDITVSVGELVCESVYTYPDITVRLHFFRSDIVFGEPVCKEHEEIKWVEKEKLRELEFCPADREIISIITG